MLLTGVGAVASAASPAPPVPTTRNAPSLPPAWEAKTREIFRKAVETPTVAGRNQVPVLAKYFAEKLGAAGWSASDLRVVPYEPTTGNSTVALIARWPSARPDGRKPIFILGHLDVVEALPADWSTGPFKLVEKDGYFVGRGTLDNKQGMVASMVAVMKLRAEGFQPGRDIVMLFTGDEETSGKGAELGASTWRKWTDAEIALNSDAGGGAFTKGGNALGFGLQTSEKTFQSFRFRIRNPGGHSSRPRPDNAIYELAGALKKREAYRFSTHIAA